MKQAKKIGISGDGEKVSSRKNLVQYINLQLAAIGLPYDDSDENSEFIKVAEGLLVDYKEKTRLLAGKYAPVDRRIQDFFNAYFQGCADQPRMPSPTFTLDEYGLARELSLPPNSDHYSNPYLTSYRVKQGILHNPKNDRRTTQGVFHIAEGGLPIPDDKKAVPVEVAARLFKEAFLPPEDLLVLPYSSQSPTPAKTFVSLLLRPIVCPEVKGITEEKSMELRFFAPGNFVSNLDFVESIFGNGGNPYVREQDASLDVAHWTGHTGCVIIAPHLCKFTKKALGLPKFQEATERQKKDGMCYKDANELYNDGQAFKLCIRNENGLIATVIADNYFGYSKKEVKSQISFSANLFGNCEEEHAGGAMAYPSYNLGDECNRAYYNSKQYPHTLSDVKAVFSDAIDFKVEGYGIDKKFPNIFYVPEDAVFNVLAQRITWKVKGKEQCLKFLPLNTYIYPFGLKIRMEKNPGAPNYRIVATNAEGVLCHKPCTVSGGGKSEISKSISDAIFAGSFFIPDFENDMKKVQELINYNYTLRHKDRSSLEGDSRQFLSPKRSIGSCIKLLTPSSEFTNGYNDWLQSVPQYVKGIALIIKRFYKEEWGDQWMNHFSVDILNGQQGFELKHMGRKLFARYMRVGLDEKGAWRTFKLRQDFVHADKLQLEDDITASTVISADRLRNLEDIYTNPSVKFVQNCEYRFFQRPDEAVNRGFDKKAESDLASPNTFISNFEPLTVEDAVNMVEEVGGFDQFTEPMRTLIEGVAKNKDCSYFVSSANPRMVDGKPSKNVRYLQTRNDLVSPIENYIAEMATRLYRHLPLNEALYWPVNAVLPGRRNNPAEPGIRPLAVYNPIHYQELPELFMDFICSLTGKSPSTTGAGSEGALTKGPFNALCAVTDLNNALVSAILTGYDGFSSAAGYIGKKYKFEHDISMLVPELWCRLTPEEKNPEFLLKEHMLEKVPDFEHKGERIPASILGYRITKKFVNLYFGRIFENPFEIFNDEMLKPELQNIDEYVDGIKNICEAQEKVALSYFNDGSIDAACPPLKAILHIMAYGHYEGMDRNDPKLRALFSREQMLKSDWYGERIFSKQQYDIELWKRHLNNLNQALNDVSTARAEEIARIEEKVQFAKNEFARVKSLEYIRSLSGSIGKDALYTK